VTNTHFEGVCAKNPKAKHGKNRQKRNDCRQVAVGMAFDENGFPLAHEVFEGNIADTKTLRRILARLALPEAGGLKPVVILDAGFASAQNLALHCGSSATTAGSKPRWNSAATTCSKPITASTAPSYGSST
jgi:transposase